MKKKKKFVLEVRNGKSQTEWEAPGIPELVGWELWPFSRHVQVYSQTIEKGSPFQKKKKFILSELRNTGVLNRTCSVFGSNESVFLMVRTSLHLHCSWEKMYQLFFLLLFFINHQDKHL